MHKYLLPSIQLTIKNTCPDGKRCQVSAYQSPAVVVKWRFCAFWSHLLTTKIQLYFHITYFCIFFLNYLHKPNRVFCVLDFFVKMRTACEMRRRSCNSCFHFIFRCFKYSYLGVNNLSCKNFKLYYFITSVKR